MFVIVVSAYFMLATAGTTRGREHNSYWGVVFVNERLPLKLKIITYNGGAEFRVYVKCDNDYWRKQQWGQFSILR